MNDVNAYGLLNGLSDDDKADVMAEVDSLTRIVELERELAEYRRKHLFEWMSYLSEEGQYAEWADGLERDLWMIVTGKYPHEMWGRFKVDDEAFDLLRKLQRKTGGWWILNGFFRFLTTEEWLPMFEKGPTRL